MLLYMMGNAKHAFYAIYSVLFLPMWKKVFNLHIYGYTTLNAFKSVVIPTSKENLTVFEESKYYGNIFTSDMSDTES